MDATVATSLGLERKQSRINRERLKMGCFFRVEEEKRHLKTFIRYDTSTADYVCACLLTGEQNKQTNE
jgi:hypothetical protein